MKIREVTTSAAILAGLLFPALAVAQQGSVPVADVQGWRTDAARIQIYSRDGSPSRVADLRGQLQSGLHEWNPDYDTIKLTADAADQRWIMAKDLNVKFCAKPLTPAISSAGGTSQNQALTMGSGGKCPQ